LDRLALALPDIRRWLEARSMMFSSRCEILGLQEGGTKPPFVVRELEENEESTIIVVGRPSSHPQ